MLHRSPYPPMRENYLKWTASQKYVIMCVYCMYVCDRERGLYRRHYISYTQFYFSDNQLKCTNVLKRLTHFLTDFVNTMVNQALFMYRKHKRTFNILYIQASQKLS